jgi:hypothetical protein
VNFWSGRSIECSVIKFCVQNIVFLLNLLAAIYVKLLNLLKRNELMKLGL